MKNDRALLARRMRGRPTFEKDSTQRIIMMFTSLGFITLLVGPAPDRRFGWSVVPVWCVVLGNVPVVVRLLDMSPERVIIGEPRRRISRRWRRSAPSTSTASEMS